MAGRDELAAQGYVKVRMADDDGDTETLWAVRVQPGVDEFRLDNSPFFAYRVSHEDIVEGRQIAEGFYQFVRVVRPSGNRTVRLIFHEDEQADSRSGRQVLDRLKRLGCSYEGATNRVISITVPPGVQLGHVAEYLTSTGLEWEYADPKYEDLFGT